MNHSDILGRSIADPAVVDYLAQQESLDAAEFRKHAEIGFYGGFDSGFGLSVEPLESYRSQFGEARSRGLPDEEERIVSRLSFTGPDALRAVQRGYRAALPLGLEFGDGSDIVAGKLGSAPIREDGSSSLPDYSAERFVHSHVVADAIGELQVIAKYDGDLRLMAVYLLQVDRDMLKAKRRKASLPKQKILPANVAKVEALRADIPTARWREAMAEGDDMFNEADIAEADAALTAFIDAVKAATGKADATAINAAVRDVVLAINAINDRSGMIETLERDELGSLIDAVVRASGFSIADDEDITSEWREW